MKIAPKVLRAAERIALLAVLLFLMLSANFVVSSAFAQDEPQKPFYDKNFAKGPFTGPDTPVPVTPGPKSVPTHVPDQPKTLVDPDTTESQKVRAMSAFLAGNPEKIKVELDQLVAFLDSREIPVRHLYIMGRPENLMAAAGILMQIGSNSRKGFKVASALEGLAEVPVKYPVKISPTWVLETDEGEILLENVGPLEKYIDKKGYYRAKEISP